jgi:hypothetical protein
MADAIYQYGSPKATHRRFVNDYTFILYILLVFALHIS